MLNQIINQTLAAGAPVSTLPPECDPLHDPQMADCGQTPGGQPQESMIDRDKADPDEPRRALVKKLTAQVKNAKRHYKNDFKKMREDMRFLRGEQWEGGKAISDDKYTANIVQRHVQQKVSALYAKNPTAVCARRKTLDFKIWDETESSLQAMQAQMQLAQQSAMAGQPMPPNPQVIATLQDFQEGSQRRAMLDKVAKTLEVVFKHSMEEQQPPFKSQMKQLVRRTVTTGVGYVKVGYQRFMEKRPEDIDKITDATQRIETVQRLLADAADGETTELDAEAEQLKLVLAELQSHPDHITKEGLVFDFPASTSIIPDIKCKNLRGFLGAQWVAQEFILSPGDVQEQYSVDLDGSTFTDYTEEGKPSIPGESQTESVKRVCVWEIYSKRDNMLYVVADGYNDFLQEPCQPPIQTDRFWPFFVLEFNEIENDESIFPQSDVSLIRPMQLEYNRSRQGLREHRHANRPKTAVAKGMLDDEDKAKLESHPANAVLELNALQQGQKVSDVLQPIKGPGIDPNMYDVNAIFQDVERVAGSQAANLGGTSGSTATESSIAESSRMSSMGSNIDDFDDMLSELFRASGQILLHEMSAQTVAQIAGPGAVWPQLSVCDIAQNLQLDIQAGSSGRPNKAAEVSNFNLMAPILMQIPGIDPVWMAKQAIQRLDDRLDPTDAIIAAAQSIVSLNAQKAAAAAPSKDQQQAQNVKDSININYADLDPTAKTSVLKSIGLDGDTKNSPAPDAGSSGQGAPPSHINDPHQQGGHGGNNAPKPVNAPNQPQQPGQQAIPHAGFESHAQQMSNT